MPSPVDSQAGTISHSISRDNRLYPVCSVTGRSQDKRTLAVLDAAKTIAGNRGVTMAQVALSWLAARPAVSSVILGARTLDQLTANLPTGLQLNTEETALLDKVSAPRVDFPYGGAIAQQMTRQIA